MLSANVQVQHSPVAKLPWPPMLQLTLLPWRQVQWVFQRLEWMKVSAGGWRSGRTPQVVHLQQKHSEDQSNMRNHTNVFEQIVLLSETKQCFVLSMQAQGVTYSVNRM